MADIDQIIAGGAGASSRADFSGLAKLPEYYWKGRDEFAKNEVRDAFRGGVPTDANGQPDFGAISKTFFQKGDIGNGIAAANLDLQRQQLKFGQGQSEAIGNFENGGQPNLPPSPNRSASVPVAPPLNRGGTTPQGAPPQNSPQAAPQGTPQGDQPGSIVGLVSSAGIPDELAGPVIAQVSAMTKTDPNAALNPSLAPRVQQVVQAAAQRLRGGQPQQPTGLAPQAAPPQAPPQAQPQGMPAPVTDRVTTSAPPSQPSQVDKAIAFYSGIMSNPNSPKQNVELAKTRLGALQQSAELTPLQKEYSQAVLQGFKGTMQDFATEMESQKTAATEEAKSSTKKYEGLVESGTKAQMEIPQLELLQEQMKDPNFFSGAGEKYNLLYKRLKSAVGIDPEAAVPQEYLRKATAANVLSSLGALKGLGQIRVAEINMAREAAASPENSVPANQLLVEISKRSHQRNADIAEMAQTYKEKKGVLDAGFDKQVTAYYKQNPLFSDAEIKDWHKVIGQQKTAAAPAGGQQTFASPADVRAAVSAGKLKSGDTFIDANGTPRRVP